MADLKKKDKKSDSVVDSSSSSSMEDAALNNVKKKTTPRRKGTMIPVLPLRDTVIFPKMVVPLFIGRQKSIHAIDDAYNNKKKIFLVAQKDPSIEDVSSDNLYSIGTICDILQVIRLSDGTIKILIEGISRAESKKIVEKDDMLVSSVSTLEDDISDRGQLEALRTVAISHFEEFIKQSKKFPIDIISSLNTIEDPSKLCDNLASYLNLKISERQEILETLLVSERLNKTIMLIEEKTELIQVEKKIKTRVKRQVEKNQKEYYLNEQLKAIYKELGDTEDINQEIRELENRIKNSHMPHDVKTKAYNELKKLRNMPSLSQEGGIIRSYIDCLLGVPWTLKNNTELDLDKAEEILNNSHYELNKVKDRILEYLAVNKRVNNMKAQIMCFVGPPGVGKTSLGKSIAKATNKDFFRLALGGITDESEIRGHRRTYIGAMPGKIIQAMKKVGSLNPVIVLDEIDKLGSDWKGDPSSALLEVLDPEQNNSFVDHYMDVPYDLSNVMFITTANSLDIPLPLLDRMEIIELSGYTEDEKLNIAKEHIIKKQIEQNGLKEDEIEIQDSAIYSIIRDYTRESGVRNLERCIARLCRKAVRKLLQDKSINKVIIDDNNIKDFLGIQKYNFLHADTQPSIGVVSGLAWTEMGGDMLSIEGLLLPGSGNIISTGQLGDVMQESIKAAYSYAKSQMERFKLDEETFSKNDIHIHVPEGAVPKDGPSAGITICTTIVSVLTKKPVKNDIAMTGEITLRGKVLGIGGLKEKLLAAIRGGIKKVFIPKENEKDLEDLPKNIIETLEIKCVSHIDEVLDEAFV